MRLLEYAEINEFRVVSLVFLFLDLRKLDEDEGNGNDDQDGCQDEIRKLHRICLHLDIAFPSALEAGRKSLSGVGVSAEDKLAEEHCGDKCTQSVE